MLHDIRMIEILPCQAHIWHFAPSDSSVAQGACFLNQEETARSARLHTPDAQKQFIHSRAFLRHVLSLYTGHAPHELAFATTATGKPYLAQNAAAVQFNLSHSHARAAVIVTQNMACGIDIEYLPKIDAAYFSLSDRIMSPQEQQHFRTLDMNGKRAFLAALWTIKEAYLKAIGLGLSYNSLTDLQIDWPERNVPGMNAPLIIDSNDPGATMRYCARTLHLNGRDADDYAGACVTDCNEREIMYFSATVESLSEFSAPITLMRSGQ